MNPKAALILIFFVLSLVPTGLSTSDCPASQPYFGPYNKVQIFNSAGELKGYKLVNEEFIIKATRIDGDNTKALTNQNAKIYFYGGETKASLVDQGKTNNKGEYRYTPTNTGKYKIECAGRVLTLEIKRLLKPSDLGAVCGDGICDSGKLETRESCPIDCTECGDAICEGSENKDNCPDDCIICGDGECDPEEYSPTTCSCVVDCIVCGDGSCDSAHGETSETCAKDCGNTPQQKEKTDIIKTLLDNWIIIAIILGAIVGYFIYKKRKNTDENYDERDDWSNEPKPKKNKKRANALENDGEVMDLINELIDSGISNKRLTGKLREFGVDESDAEEMIKRAKKSK